VAEDPEIRAMASVAEILSQLESGAAERVLRWAAERFGVSFGPKVKTRPHQEAVSPDSNTRNFADFFAELHPTTENDKVLVAGYWLQQIQGQEELDAQQVNSELRHLGHAISNITRTFGRLMEQRPQLAIQTHKGGASKQARKRYRITAEGIRSVERLIQTLSTGAPQES